MEARKNLVDQDNALIDGIRKHLMGQNLIIGKQSYTPEQIISLLDGRVTTGKAVATAKSAWQAAIKADRDERTTTRAFVRGFTTIVQGMFNELPDTLAGFGLKPRKSTKKSVETLSTQIAKNLATREARGTKGKRQKEGIHGSITPAPSKDGSGAAQPPVPPKPTA